MKEQIKLARYLISRGEEYLAKELEDLKTERLLKDAEIKYLWNLLTKFKAELLRSDQENIEEKEFIVICESPHTCPFCEGNKVIYDGFIKRSFSCPECKGTGQV